MSSDNGTYVVDKYIGDAEFSGDHIGKLLCIVIAVAVADIYGLPFGINHGLLHSFNESLDRCVSAPRLCHIDKLSVVINVHYGLDLKDSSHNCGRSGYASAALEEEKILDREPVCKVELKSLDVRRKLLESCSHVFLIHRIFYKQTLTECRAERVDREDLTFGA